MKKISSLIIIALSLQLLSNSQTLRRPVAAGYPGLGAYSMAHVDVFSFAANQASLARINNLSAGVYGEKRYMLNELSFYSLAFVVPTKSGNFGIKGSYYGFNLYNESQAGLAYARSLGSKIDIGVQFNYNTIKVAGYGNAYAISAEAGIILHLSDKLHAGIHLNNPTGGKYNKSEDEKLPFVYTAGLGYEASEKFFVSGEVQKEEDQPVNVNAGLQYKFLSQLIARAGLSSASSTVWMGIGVSMKSFRIDAAASYHPHLGITPGLMLVFNFRSTETKDEKTD